VASADSPPAAAYFALPIEASIAATSSTPYRPLAWTAVACGLGIAADNYLHSRYEASLFVAWWLISAAALVFSEFAGRRGNELIAIAALLTAVAGAGGAWHHRCWNEFPANDLGRFAADQPGPACVAGIVVERVKTSPPADNSPLRALPAQTISETTLQVARIRDGAAWRKADGLTRLRIAGEAPKVAPGDDIIVFAQIGRPSPPLNPGEYDWSAHERRARRNCELYCDHPRCVAIVAQAPSLGITSWLADVRLWCERQLSANVSPESAPLVLATLLGDQERLSDSTKDAFLNTGAIHLLVVSGAHVALLAGIIWWIVQGTPLSHGIRLSLMIGVVALYALIVGLQPSVTRATILTVMAAVALVTGRAPSMGNILGLAALAVIALNPCELFRAGTQFSFLAVAVLFVISQWNWQRESPDPLMRMIVDYYPWPRRVLRRAGHAIVAMVVASLVVGVAMAPLVAYHFHVVTPAGILLTPLAGPLIAIALASGLGVVTIGWLAPPLGWGLGWICGESLRLAEALVQFAANLPGSYFYTPGFAAWWLLAFYGVAGLWLALPQLRPTWSWRVSAALVWFAVGYASIGFGRIAPNTLRCTFLAMGHGACTVLELPSGQTILYDAGSLNSPDAACKSISAFLWSRGIPRIDALILSHADIDHYNAAPGLLKRFPIDVVYVSPMMFDPVATGGDLTAPNYLRDVLAAAKVPLREIWMGDRLRTGDAAVTIEVHHPPREGLFARDNANSLLLAVEFAGRRILLPGDLESPGIERVIADPPLDCDILLAPHHGSPLSDPPGFASWCTPEWVVFSGGDRDRTMLSQHSYQAAGAAVRHTAASGAIAFILGAHGELAMEAHSAK
jgi:competence protein ComEC